MRRLIAEVHTLKGKQTGKRRLSSLLLACAFVTTVSPCGAVYAQGYRQAGADPVDALREVLRTPAESPGLRDAKLKTAVSALHGIGDLRRALALPDWRDGDLDPSLVAVDMPSRSLVADLRAEVGPDAYASEERRGRMLTMDEAVGLGRD